VTLELGTAPEGLVETLGDKLGLVKHRAKSDMQRFKGVHRVPGCGVRKQPDRPRPPELINCWEGLINYLAG
jgi:hypothetical protein